MADTATPIQRRERLTTLGRLHVAHPEVLYPKDLEELSQILERSRKGGRRVTVRGGSQSLDDQPLNEDWVIDSSVFNAIREIDTDRARITVQAGARWGDIVTEMSSRGLAPYVVANTKKATVGGSLSANCLARSSTVVGPEGEHIECFKLLTVSGHVIECSRRQNADLFYAAIGGFGYLGVVLEATYRLREVGRDARMETVAKRYPDSEELLTELIGASESRDVWDAVHATLFYHGRGTRGVILRSRFVRGKSLNRLPIHQPPNALHTAVRILSRFSNTRTVAWNRLYDEIENHNPYVDDVQGYAFLADGPGSSRQLVERFSLPVAPVQQSFVVPKEALVLFVHETEQCWRALGVLPDSIEVMRVAPDEFLLSPTNGRPGYVVTAVFDDLPKRQVPRVRETLMALSQECARLGGRVHLVNNVYCATETLGEMYREAFSRFLTLKSRLDPDCVLRNAFFDRVFGAPVIIP